MLLLAAFVLKAICADSDEPAKIVYTTPVIHRLNDKEEIGNKDGFIGTLVVGIAVGILGFIMSFISTCVCVRPLVQSHQQKDDFGDLEIDEFSD